MNSTSALPEPPVRTWTAAQLRQLPPAERDAILAEAARLAENDYRTDADLTATATGAAAGSAEAWSLNSD
jgi:acyl-CoA reductase-like NAD-dependent aldehyde dehydrogenase